MKLFFGALFMVIAGMPLLTSAATSGFEVTGWMPYWRGATSTRDVMPHLDELTEINPFVYTLKSDGSIVDNAGLDQEPWVSVIAAAKAKGVRVIPTIMSGSGSTIYALLSHSTSRIALEDRIANLVKSNDFDGIDIDFEGKTAATKDYFSTFLKGLYMRMGQKWVMCTIESRTPLNDRYYGTTIPADATIYSNDFVEINKYCDRVRIMAYDQQGIDQALNASAASSSQVYGPVADPRWVTKAVQLAERSISPHKILIGVPTYGYEYEVTAYANNEYLYDILWTFNPGWATQIMSKYGVTAVRNKAGEMQLTYTPVQNDAGLMPRAPMPNSAMVAATAASMIANSGNTHASFHLLDWPDAQSIAGKIELAQLLGVRGVSIFKLDGGEDQGIWDVLQGVKGTPVSTAAISAPPEIANAAPVLGSALTRGLEIGSTGSDVKTLQKILNADAATQVSSSGAGSPGHETTAFGPATKAAVEKFQEKYGIASAGNSGYGYVGPKTRAKLNAVLASL